MLGSGLIGAAGSSGGGGGAAPTLSGGATLTNTTNASSFTWTGGFTPGTGDVLIRGILRVNSSPAPSLTLKIGSITATMRVFQAANGAGKAMAFIATARGVPTGSALDVLLTGTSGFGKPVLRVVDINGWGGLIGGSGSSVLTASAAGVSASLTTQGSSRLLVGCGGAVNDAVASLSATGWTKSIEAAASTGAGTSVDAAFWSKTGGALGTVETLAVTSSTSWTDWAAGVLELK